MREGILKVPIHPYEASLLNGILEIVTLLGNGNACCFAKKRTGQISV